MSASVNRRKEASFSSSNSNWRLRIWKRRRRSRRRAPRLQRRRAPGRHAGALNAGRASCRRTAGRTRLRARAVCLRQMRRRAIAQARRGGVEDAGMRAAPLESHRTHAREVRLSRLRGDHRAAGAVAFDPARLRRPEPAGHDPRRQVRRSFAAEPPERGFRPRRDRTRRLDAGRLGRRMRQGCSTLSTECH